MQTSQNETDEWKVAQTVDQIQNPEVRKEIENLMSNPHNAIPYEVNYKLSPKSGFFIYIKNPLKYTFLNASITHFLISGVYIGYETTTVWYLPVE